MSNSPPDIELRPKTKIVHDLIERLKSLDVNKEKPIMAEQRDPGTLGRQCKIQTNVFGLAATKPGLRIFHYHVLISADLNTKKTIEFTKKGKEDHIVTERRKKCISIMKAAYIKHPEIFGNNVYKLFYDGQCILYTLNELFEKPKRHINIEVLGKDAGIDLGDLICKITITRTETSGEDFIFDESTLLEKTASSNLEENDRRIQHFMEIVLNQHAIMHPEDHLVFENGKTYLTKPWEFKFEERDCPKVDDGKRLMVGIQKSTRQIEGPHGRGFNNPSLVIDAKKASFHEDISFIKKAEEILNGLDPCCQRSIEKLNQICRGIFVSLTHLNRDKRVQIVGISIKTANDCRFETQDGNSLTVNEYFASKYQLELRFPNLPLVMTKERGHVNFYPMEVCHVVPGQRVTVPQQTPQESQKTTRNCAIPPCLRQKNIMKGADALHLFPDESYENKYIENAGIQVYKRALAVEGRVLPSPNVVFANNSSYPVDNGQWRPQRAQFFRSAGCDLWAIYAIVAPGSRGITNNDLTEFAKRYNSVCREFGINMGVPAESRVLAEHEIKDRLAFASAHNCQFVLLVTQDSLSSMHKNIKLWEREFQIITQDIRMSNASKILRENKMLTLQNIVQKTNIKLGGLNYKLNMSTMSAKAETWLAPTRLVLGIAISHAPPVHRDDRKATPSVIGYCCNWKQNPLDFVGDYFFQESKREELCAIDHIIEECIVRYIKVHNANPEELILYRTGVAEGSFSSILSLEIPLIRSLLAKHSEKKCKFTMIVAQKDHNIRLMSDRINPADKPIAQNIKPGVVVDSQLTHPSFKEFYLNSHLTLQGSAKSPRYTVLYDELDMGLDELEGMTYALAHGHQIINQVISLPVPLYVANRFAERGRNMLSAYWTLNPDQADLSSDSSSSQDYNRLSDLLSLRTTRLSNFRINA